MKKVPFSATPAITMMLREMGYELIDTLPRKLVSYRQSHPCQVLYALSIDENESDLAIVTWGGHEDRYYGETYFYQWEISGTLPEVLDEKNAEHMKLCWHWKSRRRFNEEPTEEMVDEDSLFYAEVLYLSA